MTKKVDYSLPEIDIYYQLGTDENYQYLKCSYKSVPNHIESLRYTDMYIYLGTTELTSFDREEYDSDPENMLISIGEKLRSHGQESAADFFVHYYSTSGSVELFE